MYVVNCYAVEDKRYFDKEFDSYYKATRFIYKCKYSKRVKVVGYNFQIQ